MLWLLVLYIFVAIIVGIMSYYETKIEYPNCDPYTNFFASQIFGVAWPVWVFIKLWYRL